MAAGLMVGPEKKERVNVRIGPRIEEAMVAVLGRLLMVVGEGGEKGAGYLWRARRGDDG